MSELVSQNGWPVNPPTTSRLVPGTDVRIRVADGVAGDTLIEFAARIHHRVQSISTGRGILDDWGFANREVRGGGDISNHASGTAVDLNATRHPLGQAGTFTHEQVNEIHRLLAEFGGVIRWGGDYTGRKDEMHFEIDADHDRVAEVARQILEGDDAMSLSEVERMLWEGGPVAGKVAPGTLVADVRELKAMVWKGGSVPGTVAEGSLFGRMQRMENTLSRIADKLGVPTD